jgi:hypothetical protein
MCWWRCTLAVRRRRSPPARRGPIALVLTGTDVYRDIDRDASAQASLVHADRMVVLQELGAQRLPAALRDRCSVCFQSCGRRKTVVKTRRHLRALMVGHLRDEKSPQTYFAAVRLLRERTDILLDPSVPRWTLHSANRPGRWRERKPTTAGSRNWITAPRGSTFSARTCSCTPAASKAARM